MQTISVEPVGETWTVASTLAANPMVFSRASQAESAARSLGQRLAAEGHVVEIRIHLKDASLAAKVICQP